MKTSPEWISILGCGWLGLPLAEALLRSGYRVKGATTTLQKEQVLESAGVQPYLVKLCPGVEGDRIADFFEADVLVLTVPPPRSVENRIVHYCRQVEAAAEAAAAGGVMHLLYTSSTGVYPPLRRVVTEEDAATEAQAASLKRESSRAVLAAEQALREATARSGLGLTVVRLAGLYGPGREPGRFLAGKSDLPEGGRPVNFVHRDDAVGILQAVIDRGAWGEVFNACADAHPTRQVFFRTRAEAAGLEPPAFADGEKGAFKIVSNAKVKEHLGYTFRHPSPMS